MKGEASRDAGGKLGLSVALARLGAVGLDAKDSKTQLKVPKQKSKMIPSASFFFFKIL